MKNLMLVLVVGMITSGVMADREGFYLSGGLGLHTSTFEGYDDYGYSISETNSGFQTSFKVGGYVSDEVAIYYLREASWWDDEDNLSTMVAGISGVGVSVYTQSDGSAAGYFEAGLGIGDVTNADTGRSEPANGLSFLLGVGIEATDHLQLGATFMEVNVDDRDYYDIHYRNRSFAFKAELKL